MGKYKTYKNYKPSGVEWAEEIPKHWELRKLKFVAQLRYGDSLPSESRDDGEISVFGSNGSVGSHSTSNTKAPCIIVGRKGSYGKVTFSESPVFAIDTTYFIDASTIQTSLSFRWLYYALSTLGLDSFSQDTGVPGLSREFAHNRPLIFPPLAEQKSIASFLDRETTRIDALITKKRQLIDLLQKKRDAIIHQAISRGIKSGVQIVKTESVFFTSIPNNWKIIRLKFVVKSVIDGPHFSPPYAEPEDGIMFISARNVKVDEWSFDDAKYISEEYYREFCKRVLPQRGDILYTKGGTTGVARVVDFDTHFQVWVHIAVLKVAKERILPEYLAFALNSSGCYAQSQLYTRGATNNDLGLNRMVDIEFPLPPLEEQDKILNWLNTRVYKLDNSKRKIESQIDLMKSLRQALITTAVTGKIDVREGVDHAC